MLRFFATAWDPPFRLRSQAFRASDGETRRSAKGAKAAGGFAAAVLAAAALLSAQSSTNRSIWDGIYTEAQARRGAEAYNSECSYCHRDDLTGGFFDGGAGQAPALAGPRAFGSSFGERWNDATVGEMIATLASTMPQQKPASLTLQQYVDIAAYLFSKNGIPPGSSELPTDVEALGRIAIEAKK